MNRFLAYPMQAGRQSGMIFSGLQPGMTEKVQVMPADFKPASMTATFLFSGFRIKSGMTNGVINYLRINIKLSTITPAGGLRMYQAIA
ncbi:MAG: hypothetical protein ABR936_09330 [Bacteroidota bacterium]|jgi:hypothetical protein